MQTDILDCLDVYKRQVKVSIDTRIGLVKDADKIIFHSRLVFYVKAELTVHGFELIA